MSLKSAIIPIGLGAVALAALVMSSRKKAHAEQQLPPGEGYSQLPAGGTKAAPEPSPRSKSHSEMSEGLKRQTAEALARLGVHPLTGKLSGSATAADVAFATQTIGLLQSEGFYETASQLQKYANQAAAATPTPAEAKPIEQNAPPGLTAAQAAYIARVFAMERNPAVIGTFIEWLKKLPPSQQRDDAIGMAEALKLQLLAAQSTAATLDKIDQIQKAPTIADVSKVSAPLPAAPPAMAPAPASQALPAAGANASAAPTPAPAARWSPSTDIERSAAAMVLHLRELQRKYGGPKAAKGKQDTTLVKRFQALANLKQDGLPGPQTFVLASSKGAVALPFVMYWPRSANAAYVLKYRDSLRRVADALDSKGMKDEANTLRIVANAERGQGGIIGPLAPAA